jgi:hypothetical protein
MVQLAKLTFNGEGMDIVLSATDGARIPEVQPDSK